MNLKNRFSLGCSTILLVTAAVLLYTALGGSRSLGAISEPLLIALGMAVVGAIGIVGSIDKIRREEGDALGNDKWLVIFGSFLFTAGASLLALGGLCSMMGVKEFNSMAVGGGLMILVAAALASWRRGRNKP